MITSYIPKVKSKVKCRPVSVITTYIPKDKNNPISRETLARLCGLQDRAMRTAIRRAREQGAPIIAHPNGGYYLSDEAADIQMLMGMYWSRAMSLLRTYWRLKRLLVSSNQIGFNEYIAFMKTVEQEQI